MASRLIAVFRVLAFSRIRKYSFNIKFSYLFVINECSTTNTCTCRFIVILINKKEAIPFFQNK